MPILDPNSLEFLSRSADQTRRIGIRLGSLLSVGDVVHLNGDLGTGKTTLVQGIANGWGSLDQVSSPTFVIMNIYRRTDGEKLAHLDAYRLGSADEADLLDLEEMLALGPMVVEWAEQIEEALPKNHLKIELAHSGVELRSLQFSAEGPRYKEMLDQLQEVMFGVW